MDGFNVIPVSGAPKNDPTPQQPQSPAGTTPELKPIDPTIQFIDEGEEKEKKAQEERGGSLYFAMSLIVFFGVCGYFIFLVAYRMSLLEQIGGYSQALTQLNSQIDLTEMKEFQAMDITLKAINGKLGKHVLNTAILAMVNQNIRRSLQVTEYRLDIKETEVEVNISAIAPSFKELAEQTERFFQLKDRGDLKNFTVTDLSLEAETKRVKFSMRLVFDKSKFSALTTSNNSVIVQQAQQAQQQAAQQASSTQEVVPPENAATTTPQN